MSYGIMLIMARRNQHAMKLSMLLGFLAGVILLSLLPMPIRFSRPAIFIFYCGVQLGRAQHLHLAASRYGTVTFSFYLYGIAHYCCLCLPDGRHTRCPASRYCFLGQPFFSATITTSAGHYFYFVCYSAV